MLDLFKRIFSKPDGSPPVAAPVQPVRVLPKATAPQPAPPEPKPAPSAPSAPPAPQQVGDAILLPLGDIVARLPGAIAPLVSTPVTGTFPLPVKTALGQLPSGAVRVPFGQIRQAAPPGTFPDNASFDETLVDLPLPQILAAMNPSLLARRSGQTQVEVPAEITGVFPVKNNAPVKSAAPMATAAPVPPPPKPAFTASTPPPATTFTSKPPPVVPKLPTPAAAPPAPSMPTPAPAPAPTPAPQVSTGGTLRLPLSALYEFWPDSVRQDIAQSNLNAASVALPMNRLDAAMKTGRVTFTWGELIQWLDVSSASISSLHRETTLELPLKVITPLFMSQLRGAVTQKKVGIGENIPNLFAGLGKPFVPEAPAPSPVPVPPAPVAVPPPPVEAPVPANVLGEIFGQLAKKEWSPQEITQGLNALPGIAASLIAMSDGLFVAGALPPPLKSETLAAFLPQMFGRMAHYSGEIQLGSLTAMTLMAGQTSCAIFKTPALYLAVLGKPGQTLPDALLQRVASELAKRTQ